MHFGSLLGTLNVLLHQTWLNVPLSNPESILYVILNAVLQLLAALGVFTPSA